MDLAARTPVPGQLEAEDGDLLNFPLETSNAQQSSPKRTRWDIQPQPSALTLEDLTRSLAPLTGTLQTLTRRMESVEGQVSDKVGQALDLIRTVDARQKEMTKQIEGVQTAVERQANRNQEQDQAIADVVRRLEALEEQGQSGTWRRQGREEGDDRGPAVIIGGWRPDSEADDLLQKARDFVKAHELPLTMNDAFVPGKQNSFVVVPLTCQQGETPQTMTRRAITAVELVRRLQYKTGHKDDRDKDHVVWMALSQPPEVRRRARTTAKTKRAILEGAEKNGGQLPPAAVRADYRRGAVFIEGYKVAGSGPRPTSGEVLISDYGWVNAEAVCQKTKETTQSFADRWRKLVEAIY